MIFFWLDTQTLKRLSRITRVEKVFDGRMPSLVSLAAPYPRAIIHLRSVSLALPRSNGVIEDPSVTKSSGTCPPPSSTKVDSMSEKSVRASLLTPAGTKPGQFTIKGAHTPASSSVPLDPTTSLPLRRPITPRGGAADPLSVVKMTIVRSRMPRSSIYLKN